jgi:hypothetical protein
VLLPLPVVAGTGLILACSFLGFSVSLDEPIELFKFTSGEGDPEGTFCPVTCVIGLLPLFAPFGLLLELLESPGERCVAAEGVLFRTNDDAAAWLFEFNELFVLERGVEPVPILVFSLSFPPAFSRKPNMLRDGSTFSD